MLTQIKANLRQNLDHASIMPGRKTHILAVARLAKELAQIHDQPPLKAEIAGLLHDWARNWPNRKLVQSASKYKLKMPELAWTIQNEPNLLHGPVAAEYARREFKIKDASILSAVAKHSLAHWQMSPMDQILFVADFAAYDRRYPQARAVRLLAPKNLQAAFLKALASKITWCLEAKRKMHPFSLIVWNAWAEKSRAV
jgi:predicted HD superfamily hydrolase involved in NAD metabolism